MGNRKDWLNATLETLNEGLYEREDIIAKTLLAVLSGQSVFLYGPPGTAKSLIARRISCVFKDSNYFEYLMQRFSTPEDVFGPVSLSELKKDNYLRKTENYLPEADIAFLDEIWKSSPAILNTLLTIINERKFKNGTVLEDVPLKAIISASNEFPAQNSGLDALYDRFIVRLPVEPISENDSFDRMISESNVSDSVTIATPISTEEWKAIIKESQAVKIDENVYSILHKIRGSLKEYLSGDNPIPTYISDRRWQKAISILKTAALLSGRDRVMPMDALILKSCLWSTNGNRLVLDNIIDEAVCSMNESLRRDEESWWDRFSKLDEEVHDVFKLIPKTVREPIVINNVACIDVSVRLGLSEKTLNIPYGPKAIGAVYSAWDNAGNAYRFLVVDTQGNNAIIKFGDYSEDLISVPMAIGESARVPESTRSTYRRAVESLKADLNAILEKMQSGYEGLIETSKTPFVSDIDKSRVFSVMEKDLNVMKDKIPVVEGLLKFIDEYD